MAECKYCDFYVKDDATGANCIKVESIEKLTEIIAGLVKEGLTFKSWQDGHNWIIELTGGY